MKESTFTLCVIFSIMALGIIFVKEDKKCFSSPMLPHCYTALKGK